MVKDNATGTKMKNKAIWTLCTCLAHLWIKHIMCTDSFNSHNNIRRKIRGLPSVHFRKGEAERGWVAHGELQSWGASPGSLASESLSQPLLLKEKKPRGSLEVTADGSGEEDELPCQHLCMWDSGGDFERPKAKDWHSHLECPREPGTAVVSCCSRGQRWSHPVPGTAVVSCCSRGQRWSHAVPGDSGGLMLFLAQWWYHPVLLDVIRRGAAALVQHSVWRVGSGWGWTWAHVWPHHWPHAGPWAWTFPPVRMIIPSLQDGSEKAALNLSIKDSKIVASDPITSWQIGKKWKQWQIFFSWAPKSLATVTSAMKLKDACSLEGKLWQT